MLSKVLEILANSDDFISGEDIAKSLNVTRASIWKNISKLKSMGYNILSSTNKGYKLIKDNNKYNKLEVEKILKTKILGKEIYFFDEIDSTNNYAKIIANSVSEGAIILANNQTNGRGRFDRNWVCEKNSGVFLSLILKPCIDIFSISNITMMASVSLCNTISFFTGEKAMIKWPNDILVNNKKICGVLTEVSAQMDKIDYIVLGIGINVNNKNFEGELLNKATSIYKQINKNVNRQEVVSYFLNDFENNYITYKNTFDINISEYKKLCINIDRQVKVVYKGKEIIGKVVDVCKDGNLIIKTENDTIKIVSGEVSLRTSSGEYI